MTAHSEEGGVKLIYSPEWEAQIYRTIPTDVWKQVKELRKPTLVIRGENSNTFTNESEEAFKKIKPSASFSVVANAGHLVSQEQPDEVGRIILNFLTRDS
jgi:2-(acetamidomethylene)succinate hydrolase